MNTTTEPSGNRTGHEDIDKPAEKDLQDLQHEELSGIEEQEEGDESLASSDTDEDADEGVGDGNMGGIKPGKVHR
jgi:hypothetical protein